MRIMKTCFMHLVLIEIIAAAEVYNLTPLRNMFALPCLVLVFASEALGLCGDNIKWSHTVTMDDIYGLWYGVGYAQHTPDLTNKPNDVGCVTMFILDVSTENHADQIDWSIMKRTYKDNNWRSSKDNLWTGKSNLASSWLDLRLNQRLKRDIYNERSIRVTWDEDGQTLAQVYVYDPNDPGLLVADDRGVVEKELRAKGIEIYKGNEIPRHPQVIRIIQLSEDTLILNHCSELGDSGIFTLILKRRPHRMRQADWFDLKTKFFNFELPNIHRYTAICAGCIAKSSVIVILVCLLASIYNIM